MQHIKAAHPSGVDALVGLDARGFLLGPWIASLLQIPFAPVRKKGKLPGETLSVSYAKEYGVDHFEMQRDAVTQGQRVVVLDDLIATGGSAKAAEELVKHAGGSVVEFIFFIELKALEGRKVLKAPVHAILEFP